MTYGIIGIKEGLGPGDQVPLRREIDEWWFSKDVNDLSQRSLFIYALQKFMDMPPNPDDPEDLSYFSIAGIHGKPLKPWDTTTTKNAQYCVHGEATFPPWHRPYMLLYEQRLYEIMLELIPTKFASSDQDAMYHAAKTWRLPYWDWAMKKPAWDPSNPDSPKNLGPPVKINVPFLLTQKTVQVKTKTGVATVSNPLWRFVLPKNESHPDRELFGAFGINDITREGELKRYTACRATNRQPSTIDPRDLNYESHWVNGNEQNWKIIRGELQGAEDIYSNTLPESVYRLFSSLRSRFEEFATEKWSEGQPPRTYASLEDVHGNVHVFAGGKGQMGEVAVAAFDPVFWLHHCNIDRLFAIWQDLYPEKYSKWLKESQDSKTSLAPFHKDAKGDYYDSFACSYQQKDLGYTYPELQWWLDKYKTGGVFDKQKYQSDLRRNVELKYSTTGKSTLLLNPGIASAHMSAMTEQNLAVENFPPPLIQQAERTMKEPQKPIAIPPAASWEENDYVVNVVYDRFALDGNPYLIRVFLGDVPEGPPFYFEYTPTQIGLVYNFSGSETARGTGPEGCENCKKQRAEGALSSGQLILTDYLVENIKKEEQLRGMILPSLSRDEVVPYLRKNLHWRISDHDDNTVPKETMPSLKISVATAKVTHYAQPDRFSEYGDYEVLWAVTEDRLAGANPGDLGPTAS